MKTQLLFFLLITLFGCSNKQNRIDQFEKHLGIEKSQALTFKVESFKRFLKTNFPEQSFKASCEEFLKEVSANGFEENKWKYNRDDFEKMKTLTVSSGLKKEIWKTADSVWIEDKFLVKQSSYILGQDTLISSISSPLYTIPDTSKIDSVIKNTTNTIFDYNLKGKFFTGIKDLDDPILNEYIDSKFQAGFIALPLIASGILNSNQDFSDYFIIRIIAIELYS